jgi:hypothetical protein
MGVKVKKFTKKFRQPVRQRLFNPFGFVVTGQAGVF